MVVGICFLLAPFVIFSLGFFWVRPGPQYNQRKSALAALAAAFVYTGAYLCFAGWLYKDLMSDFPDLYVTPFEPDYFAVQTLTTVGYGIDLCGHLKNEPNMPEMSHLDLCNLHKKFHMRASFLMAGGAVGWLLIIGSLIEYIKRSFFPQLRYFP